MNSKSCLRHALRFRYQHLHTALNEIPAPLLGTSSWKLFRQQHHHLNFNLKTSFEDEKSLIEFLWVAMMLVDISKASERNTGNSSSSSLEFRLYITLVTLHLSWKVFPHLVMMGLNVGSRISHYKHFSRTYEIIDMVACSLRWYYKHLSISQQLDIMLCNDCSIWCFMNEYTYCMMFLREYLSMYLEHSRIYAATCAACVL